MIKIINKKQDENKSEKSMITSTHPLRNYKLIIFSFFLLIIIISSTILTADQTITTPSGNQINFLTNVKPVLENGNYKYVLKEGESLSVKYNDKFTAEYSNLKTSSSGLPTLIFDKTGRLIEADFTTGKSGEYVFGNERISLAQGTEIHFKDKKARIKVSDGKIILPKSINEKSGESIFEFFSENKKFDLNGNVFEGYSLKFEKGNLFFDFNGNAKLNSLNIINGDARRVYIDFKGEINKEYNGAYISIDDKKGIFVTGSNINERGPKISFTKDNPYGLKINNDHFAVWSLGNPDGAYVKIVNRNSEGRVPVMSSLNQFAMNFDEKSAHYSYSQGKLFFSPKVLLTGFQTTKTTSPIEIHNFKGSFDNLQPVSSSDGKPNILGITPEASWAYGINPEYIKTSIGYKEYPSLKTGFSNSWLYYNLGSVAELRRLTGVKINDNTRLLNDAGYRKMFADIMLGLPAPVLKDLKELKSGISIIGHAWYAGLSGDDFINIKSSYFNPETIRHEISHQRHFALDSDFDRLWDSVSSRGVYVSNYARTNRYEDIAETASYVYQPSLWSSKLTTDPYAPVYRGKLAVLAHPKYQVITKEEFENLGLDYNKINDYITEAQKFSGRR